MPHWPSTSWKGLSTFNSFRTWSFYYQIQDEQTCLSYSESVWFPLAKAAQSDQWHWQNTLIFLLFKHKCLLSLSFPLSVNPRVVIVCGALFFVFNLSIFYKSSFLYMFSRAIHELEGQRVTSDVYNPTQICLHFNAVHILCFSCLLKSELTFFIWAAFTLLLVLSIKFLLGTFVFCLAEAISSSFSGLFDTLFLIFQIGCFYSSL